ncbi:ATP-binding protein [Streptomyces sp. NPDC050560]|uniref:ATP-binding protein n=1 Tax=Streptomyces sp. NPDC050560 TaxID=3365630 RepID=UPI0037AF5389
MNTEIAPPPTAFTGRSDAMLTDSEGTFTVQLPGTRKAARLVRHLAVRQLAVWGWPHDARPSRTAGHLVGELAANAVTHGRVPGRDFRLGMVLLDDARTLRIEVTDACPEARPATPGAAPEAKPLADSGRGLLIVQALSDHWGVYSKTPYTKTVWCQFTVT